MDSFACVAFDDLDLTWIENIADGRTIQMVIDADGDFDIDV